MVVDSGTGKTGELAVLAAQTLEELAHLHLAHGRGQLVVALEADALGHLGVEVVETLHADFAQHLTYVRLCMGEIFVGHR